MTTIAFAPDCAITRRANGSLAIRWDNGHVLNTITGAAVEYVPPHMRLTVVRDDDDLVYMFDADIARMMAGGVSAKLAFLVATVRKVVCSMESCVINRTEAHVLSGAAPASTIPAADWHVLVERTDAVQGIVNQALTILGLNGLSMLLKGHNYVESDTVWTRLQAAVGYDAHFDTLGVADWEGIMFHDACHPFAIEWKTALVVRANTPLAGHVNGVLMKRVPAIPAGTALVFVTRAAVRQLLVSKAGAAAVLTPLDTALSALEGRIMQEPLHWCIHFATSRTRDNLAIVHQFAEASAFVYGMCLQTFDKKASIVKSAAFKSNGNNHPAMVAFGRALAIELGDEDVTVGQATALLTGPVNRANVMFAALPAIDATVTALAVGNVELASDNADAENPLDEDGPAAAPVAAAST